jgi:hypothetical protein
MKRVGKKVLSEAKKKVVAKKEFQKISITQPTAPKSKKGLNQIGLPTSDYDKFLEVLKGRVAKSQAKAVRFVNKELVLLYHSIGAEILKRQAEQFWGAKIIERISHDMSIAFPEMKGFSARN